LAKRKEQKPKAEPRPKRSKSKLAQYPAFPSDLERLPLHIPGTYQLAMGTGEEIVNWLGQAPGNAQAILIPFPNEASYRMYGPIFWHVAHKLPEIVERTQRRKFEQLVDSLTQLFMAQPGTASAVVSEAPVTQATKALPRRRWRKI